MSNLQTAEDIDGAIQGKMEQLAAAGVIRSWRMQIGAPEGAQAPEFDDRGWAVTGPTHTWSSKDGEAWFRTAVAVPPEVEGISLAGSKLELEVFLTIGATIYLNGRQMYSEPSWSDTRTVRLLLAEAYQPGMPLLLAVRCPAGDGFGYLARAWLHFSALDRSIFELDLLRAQLAFTRYLGADAGATAQLDLVALAANDWTRWQASVDATRAALAPLAGPAKEYTTHLIGHSHIDMNWLWPWRETVDVCRRDFVAMDALLGRYPEFHFSQSQASIYAVIEQEQPELFERVRRWVAEGRWEVTASTWVEGDLNQSAGEAIARHFLHTRRYIGERLGVEPLIVWEPDTFGHHAQMPQLLRLSGARYYYFCRAGRRHPLFWWEGIDGSRVLAVQDLRGYNGAIMPSDVVGALIDCAQPYGIHRGIFVYGVGDHGGGATARDIEAARAIDSAPLLPHARPSSAAGFYEAVEAEAPGARLPVVRGELNTVFEGCYTSHADIKRLNRSCENRLLSAETAATLAALLAGGPDVRAPLAEAWRTTCFHQFHDILGGCAIGVTYREAGDSLGGVLATGAALAEKAMGALAGAVDTGTDSGPKIVVFNSLAWPRDDVVRLPLAQWDGPAPAWLVDDWGRATPAQVSGEDLVFVAHRLPALGFRVYRPAQAAAAAYDPAVAVPDTNVVENGLLRLHVHPASGAIDQLVDLSTQRDLAGGWAGWGPEAKINAGMINRLQVLWEQPHPMSAWNIGDITRIDNLIAGAALRVVEQGPVRAAIEVRRQILHSTFVQRIVLYAGLRRIDFETEIDWHERGSSHEDAPMLRATFSPYLGQTRATFEIPYAGLERAEDGRETPGLRWADLSERAEGGYGLSLLNDGKYGHQALGNTLGLTLLRASYEPDNNPDEGLHRFTYSLYPHPGPWEQAGSAQRAAEFNQPVLAAVTGDHRGPIRPSQAWLACDPANVMVSAVKMAEDQPESGRAVVVRVFELHGEAAEATLRPAWPVMHAEETDLIERPARRIPVEDGVLRLSLRAHEIKTIKLYSASPAIT